MLKKIENAYAYIFACLWVFSSWLAERLDGVGDWMVDQVDPNDYLAGFIGAVFLMLLPWLVGIIDIVVRG